MRINCIAFIALLGASACGGDDKGDDTNTVAPTPNANAVIPANGFAGRQLRVQISGDNTAWTSTTTVSMGDGITVGTVTAASPTDLFAEITIAPDAKIGARDVTLGDGTKLTGAFEVGAPATITYQGTVAQGSIGLFTIVNHDLENLFDTTSTGDGFTTPIVYTNFNIDAPAGVTFNISSVTEFGASGSFLIDTDASAGGALKLASGADGGTVVSSQFDNITVAPRTATPITSGTAASLTSTKPFDSSLSSFSATDGQLVKIDSSASAEVFVLPSSGHWADELGNNANGAYQETATGASTYYLVSLDVSGDAAAKYTVTASAVTVAQATEVEPNNTKATAQALTMPVMVKNAQIGSATDQDWYKVTVPAGGAALDIVTSAGDAKCDTLIDVYSSDGTTQVGESDDSDYLDSLVTDSLTAGTYYVVITYSSESTWAAANSHYNLLVTTE